MPPPGAVLEPTGSKARSATSSSCRIRWPSASPVRSLLNRSVPRSIARGASRPRAAMPTTTTRAAWLTSIEAPGTASTRHRSSSVEHSSSTRVSPPAVRWRRGVMSDERSTAGWPIATAKSPRAPGRRDPIRAGDYRGLCQRELERAEFRRRAVRLGRRTALSFPLFPPPQKNKSRPSDSSPDTATPEGILIFSRTSPV